MKLNSIKLVHILYLFFFLWVMILVWYGRGYIYDESPDVGRDKFYSGIDQHIPDSTNLAIAISGINALENTDVIKQGRYVSDLTIRSYKSNDDNFSKKKLEEIPKVNYVNFENTDLISCDQSDAIEFDLNQCISSASAKKLLEQNRLLLSRYLSLYNINNWQGSSFANGQLLINLNKLLSIKVKLLIMEDQLEVAYDLWRDNYVFIYNVLGKENTFIERAIFLVMEDVNLKTLEYFLFKHPQIETMQYDDLIAILNPRGLERYNLKGVLKAEYALINRGILNDKNIGKTLHVEYMRNRLYQSHLEFLQKAKMPPKTLAESEHELNDKFAYPKIFLNLSKIILPHGLSNYLVNQFIVGTNRGLVLVKSMHMKNAYINLLNQSIKIRKQKFDELSIQEYLNNSGQKYFCPFSEKPIRYSSSTKSIYCDGKGKNERVSVRL